MGRLRTVVATTLLTLLPFPVLAVDLMQAYQQAASSDPTFKAAHAQWLADKENLPIGWAALLPSFDATASLQRQRIDNTSQIGNIDSEGRFYNTSKQYGLTLTQPLFNYAAWAGVSGASAVVRQATATYSAAQQDLMLRVAQAYFGVLQAADDLRYTRAEKRAVGRQLDQTQQQFKVGLIAITAVHDAQAKYDSIVAQEIATQNALSDKREQLREITGVLYGRMSGLTKRLPLVRPTPDNINQWVTVGLRQNYLLQASKAATDAAGANIQVQSGARYPVVNATGGYTYDNESNLSGVGHSRRRVLGGGLTLSFPAFQGGGVFAKTRQARYEYQVATANWERQYRSVVSQTRQSFLGVLSGISQIKADRQAIVSAASAVQSNEAGYQVGTRTIVDVLDAQTSLYDGQKIYARDQYQYLLNTLALKQQAGTLGVGDLGLINAWLKRQRSVNPYGPEYRVTTKAKSTKMPKAKPAKPLKVSTTKVKPTVSKRSYTSTEHNILQTNLKHYTIQLVAGSHKTNVSNFVQSHHLQGKTAVYEMTSHGHPWYSVIYGEYTTRQRADAVLNGLPGSLRRIHPWVRRFSAIQRDLIG